MRRDQTYTSRCEKLCWLCLAVGVEISSGLQPHSTLSLPVYALLFVVSLSAAVTGSSRLFYLALRQGTHIHLSKVVLRWTSKPFKGR